MNEKMQRLQALLGPGVRVANEGELARLQRPDLRQRPEDHRKKDAVRFRRLNSRQPKPSTYALDDLDDYKRKQRWGRAP